MTVKRLRNGERERGAEKWSLSTKDLKPLSVGSRVIIQNQHGAGKTAKKWDRTGLVVDDLGYDKYRSMPTAGCSH